MNSGTGEVKFNDDVSVIPFLIEQKKLLRKLIKQTSSKPTAERVHDLRVTIRRLRVVVWLARLDKSMPRFRNLSGELRNLGKVLGNLRQLDVAIEDAKSYRLSISGLKVRRKKARDTVAMALTTKLSDFLEKQLKRLIRLLCERGGVMIRKAASDLLERARALKGRVPGVKKEFHRFRIFIKKVRYTIEAFGYPPGPVKALHDRLGKAHDLEVLQHLIGENEDIKRDEAKYCELAGKVAKPVMRFVCERLEALECA